MAGVRPVGLSVVGLCLVLTGCVTAATLEESQQKAYVQHQEDQRQILELSVTNTRLKQRIEELEAGIEVARQQATRAEKDWKDVRDELLKMKIEQEQQQLLGKRRDRFTRDRDADDQARLRERLDEARRRLKEVLQQLHALE